MIYHKWIVGFNGIHVQITMILFLVFVLGIVGVVSTVQFHLNDSQNVQNFIYRGKNLTTYISALILTAFIQVRCLSLLIKSQNNGFV